MGSTPVKEDLNDGYQYVIYNDVGQGGGWSQHKKWQHSRKQSRMMTRTVGNSNGNNPSPGCRSHLSQSDSHTLWSRHNSPSNGRKNKWGSKESRDITVDNGEDMDITVIHNDVTYFYSRWVMAVY